MVTTGAPAEVKLVEETDAVQEGYPSASTLTGPSWPVIVSPGATAPRSAVSAAVIDSTGAREMMFVSSVTAPFLASARPVTFAPVVTVIDVRARMVPSRVEPVPSVAELPTCQKTLAAVAPLMRFTELPDAVTRVEAVWKMNTALGSPCPSRVRIPVIEKLPVTESYTPGVTVVPPSSAGNVADGVRPAASLYAVVRSTWAAAAAVSAAWIVPTTVPGGKPVTADPGLTPTSAATTVGPVLVTVVPASTPKLPAVPSGTGAVAALAGCGDIPTARNNVVRRTVTTAGRPDRAADIRRIPATLILFPFVKAWVTAERHRTTNSPETNSIRPSPHFAGVGASPRATPADCRRQPRAGRAGEHRRMNGLIPGGVFVVKPPRRDPNPQPRVAGKAK